MKGRLLKDFGQGCVMDWRDEYGRKLCSAADAVANIQSGQRVVLGHAAGEPKILVDAMVRRGPLLEDVEVTHMVPLYPCDYAAPALESHFRDNAIFVGAGNRKAVDEGRADYTPAFFSEVPRLFKERVLPVDVALVQVAPPDDHGFMSLGVSVDYTLAAAQSASYVVAEVNTRMPATAGARLHVSEVEALIEVNYDLPELHPKPISDVDRAIGQIIADLIPDRANLQLGIGSIPDAVLQFLQDKLDLGIHTEMFSDGVVDLVERGVITSAANNINPGKLVATFLMGTKRLYNFVNRNSMVLMQPVDYTNHVMIAGRVDNLVSINSALEVDLYGQVCADTIGPRQFSGVGGQVDFVRSASLSHGGKSIIALPSTAKGGRVSRIVQRLAPGSAVTTSRNDVHLVVTEFGIADLRGKSLRQRAQALIAIAHPDFRSELQAQEC